VFFFPAGCHAVAAVRAFHPSRYLLSNVKEEKLDQ